MSKWNLIIDVAECTNCNLCTLAAMDEYVGNDFPGYSAPMPRHGHKWINILQKERGQVPTVDVAYVPTLCNHCDNAPCVAKGGGAVQKRADGIVLVDYDKCIGCKYCSWACPYGVRELDEQQKVMKKCTLCVDRITDVTLPAAERKPACVMACPTNARLFGDVHDPDSAVSLAIREQGGYTLMPEWGTHPANHYLPRRRNEITLHPDELQRVDNPLKVDGKLPRPAPGAPALDDVTSW